MLPSASRHAYRGRWARALLIGMMLWSLPGFARGRVELPPPESEMGEEEYQPSQPRPTGNSSPRKSSDVPNEKSAHGRNDVTRGVRAPTAQRDTPAQPDNETQHDPSPNEKPPAVDAENTHAPESQPASTAPDASSVGHENETAHSTKKAFVDSDGKATAGRKGSGLLWFGAVLTVLLAAVFVFT